MTSIRTIVVLIALATGAAGCNGEINRGTGGAPAPPSQPSPPQPPASYTLAVTGVDVVNKDTGESVLVGGLPAQGGELNIR